LSAVFVEQTGATTSNPPPTTTSAASGDAVPDHEVIEQTTSTLLGWVSREFIRLFVPA
jgi:hypothetical protein